MGEYLVPGFAGHLAVTRHRGRALAACAVFAIAASAAADEFDRFTNLEPVPDGIDAVAVARRADDALRSDRTYVEAAMTVMSPRLSSDRVVEFRSWEDRPSKRSFIRILGPAKDAGTGGHYDMTYCIMNNYHHPLTFPWAKKKNT